MLKCKICDYECSKNYLSTHVKKKHSLSYREYYDSYVKEENEGKCLECGKETRYNNGIGENGWKYSLYCSNRCRQLHTHGVENQFQLESVKAKAKKNEKWWNRNMPPGGPSRGGSCGGLTPAEGDVSNVWHASEHNLNFSG